MAPRSFLLFPLCLGLAIAIPEVQAPTTLTQPHESDLERWPWWNKLRECKNVCDRNKYTSREDKRYCKEGCGYGPKNSKAGCNKKCTRTRVYAKDGTYVVEGKYTRYGSPPKWKKNFGGDAALPVVACPHALPTRLAVGPCSPRRSII